MLSALPGISNTTPNLFVRHLRSFLFFGLVLELLSGHSRIFTNNANAATGEKEKPVNWELISDDDGIEVFKKEIPNSPIVAFKGQGFVEASIEKLASILIDVDRSIEWVDRLEEAKLLRAFSDLDFVVYNHVSTPPIIMKDRDFVTLFKGSYNAKEKVFTLKLAATEDENSPKTNFVRGRILDSSYIVKYVEPEKSYLVTEVHADPEGSVAKWVVNLFQKKWPRNTVESLREQANKDNIKINPVITKLFSSPPVKKTKPK